MNNAAKIGVAVGVGGVVALGGQWLYNRIAHPDSANDSLLTRATSVVTNAANRATSNCSASAVRVGYPVMRGGNPADGSVNSNSLDALRWMAIGIFGSTNAADIVCAHASCESQTGSLSTSCYNCSLFNIHHPGCGADSVKSPRSPNGKPSVMIGTERVISFLTDEPNQVEGFKSSMEHYKAFLQRKSAESGHNFFADLETRDWDNFLRGLAQIRYSPMYENAVSGGTVRDSFLRRRFERLRANGLINNINNLTG